MLTIPKVMKCLCVDVPDIKLFRSTPYYNLHNKDFLYILNGIFIKQPLRFENEENILGNRKQSKSSYL